MTILTERCRNNIRVALKGYKEKVDQAKSHIDQVKAEFGDEAEKRERERLESGLRSAREQAESAIRQAHKEAVEFTMKWGQLDGGQLTADAKLLSSGLVDPEQFDQLKGKYSNNATMLTALKKYGEQENEKAFKTARESGEPLAPMEKPFAVDDISTADDRIVNWNRLQKSAVDRLDMIDGTGNYADRWNQAFISTADPGMGIDEFGEGIDL